MKKRAVCSVHYAVCTMQFAVCTMQCALCSVHYAVCTMHPKIYTVNNALCMHKIKENEEKSENNIYSYIGRGTNPSIRGEGTGRMKKGLTKFNAHSLTAHTRKTIALNSLRPASGVNLSLNCSTRRNV